MLLLLAYHSLPSPSPSDVGARTQLGQAVNQLYLRLGELDLEVRDRFAEWFAFHLSNFNFAWPWANWTARALGPVPAAAAAAAADGLTPGAPAQAPAAAPAPDTDESAAPPQRVFVQDVLSRLVRLSYWDRVRNTIPPELMPLFPPQPAPGTVHSSLCPLCSVSLSSH
jgi:nuclear cap-binding protein subunit 1